MQFYIYEIEKDVLRYYNFAARQNDSEDISVPPNSAQSHSIQTASMQVGFKCLISAKNKRYADQNREKLNKNQAKYDKEHREEKVLKQAM